MLTSLPNNLVVAVAVASEDSSKNIKNEMKNVQFLKRIALLFHDHILNNIKSAFKFVKKIKKDNNKKAITYTIKFL